MKMNRRRFLTISAAIAGTPVWAGTHFWQGRAFGADVNLTLKGPRSATARALTEIPALLAKIERLFSLYDPASDIVRLNDTGVLHGPDPLFVALMQASDLGHQLTGGLFDPTVQPLWRAVAEQGDIDAARTAAGWSRVQFDRTAIRLAKGQALTFNGIAQGFATDLVTDRLGAMGLTDTLVNIGEYRALGGPWQLGLDDPTHGQLGFRTLNGNAIATSSPTAMLLGDRTHIMHPDGIVRWSTVSVEATTATLADCLSTALCLAPPDMVEKLRHVDGVQRITLVDFEGNLTSL